MTDSDQKTAWLERMADHVLAHGLNTASLRPLAAAAGTSDRMLIYHFGSKDRLIATLLGHLAQGLALKLSDAVPDKPLPSRAACARTILDALRAPALAPYMRVWLDIVSAAAQGGQTQRETGHAMLAMFLPWITPRLPQQDQTPETAAAVLAVLEGALVLDAVGHGPLAESAIEKLF